MQSKVIARENIIARYINCDSERITRFNIIVSYKMSNENENNSENENENENEKDSAEWKWELNENTS